MACKQNLDLRCVLISDPSTLGAGAKTRLHTPKAVTYREQPDYCRFMIGHSLVHMESRIKEFTPHCVCTTDTETESESDDEYVTPRVIMLRAWMHLCWLGAPHRRAAYPSQYWSSMPPPPHTHTLKGSFDVCVTCTRVYRMFLHSHRMHTMQATAYPAVCLLSHRMCLLLYCHAHNAGHRLSSGASPFTSHVPPFLLPCTQCRPPLMILTPCPYDPITMQATAYPAARLLSTAAV